MDTSVPAARLHPAGAVPEPRPRRAVHDRQLRLPRPLRTGDRQLVAPVRASAPHPAFDATMVHSKHRDTIVDYLGTHQHLAVDLALLGRRRRRDVPTQRRATLLRGPVGFRFPLALLGRRRRAGVVGRRRRVLPHRGPRRQPAARTAVRLPRLVHGRGATVPAETSRPTSFRSARNAVSSPGDAPSGSHSNVGGTDRKGLQGPVRRRPDVQAERPSSVRRDSQGPRDHAL